MSDQSTATSARLDIPSIMKPFLQTAETLLVDMYLRNTPAAISRVFRVHKRTPPYYPWQR